MNELGAGVGWPIELSDGLITLRPLHRRDGEVLERGALGERGLAGPLGGHSPRGQRSSPDLRGDGPQLRPGGPGRG